MNGTGGQGKRLLAKVPERKGKGMAIHIDKRKSTSSWTEETCKARSKMFYNNVGNQIVYVTVTIQDMPAAMEQYPSHDMKIEEYIAGIGKVVSFLLGDYGTD